MTDKFWREHYSWMTEDQWQCFIMLCDLFGGAHHVFGKVRACGDTGIEINSRNCINKFATFDFDYMTRAVVMAHDRLIRFAIEPSGPGMLKLVFHKRQLRDGQMHQRHPTLEDAITTIRGQVTKND